MSPQDSLGLLSHVHGGQQGTHRQASRAPCMEAGRLGVGVFLGERRGIVPAPSPVLLSEMGSGVELPQLFSGPGRSGSLSRWRLSRRLEQVSFQSQPGPFTPLCSCLAARGAQPLPVMSTPSGRPPGRSVQLPSPCQQRSSLPAPTSCPAASWRRAT